MPIMILPMTFNQYWDAFWANDAPYLLPTLLTNQEVEIVSYTEWTKPDAESKSIFGDSIIATRIVEKRINKKDEYASFYIATHVIAHIALLKKTDTQLSIMIN